MAEHIHGAAALVLIGIGLTMIVDNPFIELARMAPMGIMLGHVARAAVGEGGAGVRAAPGAGRGARGAGRSPPRVNVLVLHSRYSTGPSSGENRVVDDEVALLRAHGHDVRAVVA